MNLSRDNEVEAKLNFVLQGCHYAEVLCGKRSSFQRGKNLNRQNIALGDESMNISSLGNK